MCIKSLSVLSNVTQIVRWVVDWSARSTLSQVDYVEPISKHLLSECLIRTIYHATVHIYCQIPAVPRSKHSTSSAVPPPPLASRIANWHLKMPNKSNLAFLKVVWQWKFGFGIFWQYFNTLAVLFWINFGSNHNKKLCYCRCSRRACQ